jgi:hypothetical protein
MDSTFTLSIDWLAFTVLASNPQETMKVLGGEWSRAKGGFSRLSPLVDQGQMDCEELANWARMRLVVRMKSMSISLAVWSLRSHSIRFECS